MRTLTRRLRLRPSSSLRRLLPMLKRTSRPMCTSPTYRLHETLVRAQHRCNAVWIWPLQPHAHVLELGLAIVAAKLVRATMGSQALIALFLPSLHLVRAVQDSTTR